MLRRPCITIVPLLAAVLCACSSPAEIARREIDRVTRTAHQTEASFKRTTVTALKLLALTEREKRDAALVRAGCAEGASQPTGPCMTIAAEAQASYESKKQQIVSAATRVDAAFGALYASILVAIDVEQDLEAGLAGIASFQGAVGKLVRLLADVAAAYKAFRAAYGGGT